MLSVLMTLLQLYKLYNVKCYDDELGKMWVDEVIA